MGRDKVALFAMIREDRRAGMGIRAIARKHGVHRRTVHEALESPVPEPQKVPERAAPVRDEMAPLIDAMLAEDLDASRKQRHTARRIWARLADEHDVHPSYQYVARYAGRQRPEIGAGKKGAAESVEGFVPQLKEPGAEALCRKPHRASSRGSSSWRAGREMARHVRDFPCVRGCAAP